MKTLSSINWKRVSFVLIAMLVTALLIIAAPRTKANPSQTPPVKSLGGTASTTQAFMTPGTGTSTITYDSFTGGTDTKFDQITVAMQVHASGTPVTMRMRAEDSRNGIDWYPRSTTITTGTTTIVSGGFADYSIQIATSTTQLGGSSNASTTVTVVTTRAHQEITIDTPMRYTRIIFYLPVGSGNAALWAELVPIKEKQ